MSWALESLEMKQGKNGHWDPALMNQSRNIIIVRSL